jgi:3-oxoacyl-[acyl-carrier protein] reductase
MDLGQPASIQTATQHVLERWEGRIDVLVNNAVEWISTSEQPIALFEHVELERVARSIRSNVEGVFAMTQAVVPAMRRAQWGRIVNLSSIAATEGIPGFAWYSTAKAALHGLTRTLAHELGPWGILVNTVVPGSTRTETLVDQFPDHLLEQQARRLPIRRLLEPREVAAVVAFMGSAINTGITGEFIRVSGGRPSF